MGYAPISPKELKNIPQEVPTVPASPRVNCSRRSERKCARLIKRISRNSSKLALLGALSTLFLYCFLLVQNPTQVSLSAFEMVRINACPGFFESAEIFAGPASSDYISVHTIPRGPDVALDVNTRAYSLGYNVTLYGDELSPKSHFREYHFDAASPFKISFESTNPVHFYVVQEVVEHQDHRHGKPPQHKPVPHKNAEESEKQSVEFNEEKRRFGESGEHHGPHQWNHEGKHHKHGKHGKHYKDKSKYYHDAPKTEEPVKTPNPAPSDPHSTHKDSKGSLKGDFIVHPTGGSYVVVFALPKDSQDAFVQVKIEATINTIKFTDCPFASSLKEGRSHVTLKRGDKNHHIIATSPHAPAGTSVSIKLVPRCSRFAFIIATFLVSWVVLQLVVRYLRAHKRVGQVRQQGEQRHPCVWSRMFARQN